MIPIGQLARRTPDPSASDMHTFDENRADLDTAGPLPGLVVVGALAGVALVIGAHSVVSGLVVAVALGALWANTVGVAVVHAAGVRVAARTMLHVGIIALGLRLSLGDVLSLGGAGIATVALTVAATFFGTRALGRRLGLDPDLSLLVATGYSICGASAIAAMEPNTDADREYVAAAIGLVTVFGTCAMVALPAAGHALGLGDATLGAWIGASTHDVAQVVAGASTVGPDAVAAAIVVKLTRVAMLAPLVAGVSVARRRHGAGATPGNGKTSTPPALLPVFVIGFLVMAVVRSTGLLPSGAIASGRLLETVALTVAMVGLGAGVRIAALRRLGLRPLVLGAAAWIVVAGVSLIGVVVSA